MIEYILNWVVVVLQEKGEPMSVNDIANRMNRELHTTRPQLDALLSLDQRFRRIGPDSWVLKSEEPTKDQIVLNDSGDKDNIYDLVQKAITLREEASKRLFVERSNLQENINSIETRLQEIYDLLRGLDYDQTQRITGRDKTPVIRKSSTTRNKLDGRYRSVWPLPGERSKLLQNLVLILEKIEREHSTFDILINWFKEFFEVGNWAKHSLVACVFYPGFAERIDDQVQLTDLGKEYLATQDVNLVISAVQKSFWGIEEILIWLEEQPLTLEQLRLRFNAIGAGWKKLGQVRYRLNWLIATGLVQEEPDERPKLYTIIRS